MNEDVLRQLLESLRGGEVGVDEVIERICRLPFEELGFATVDHHRAIRCGSPEVIYCPGKTARQVAEIFKRLAAEGGNVLATRATPEQYEAVAAELARVEYHEQARTITLHQGGRREPVGLVAVVSAGTSDLAVAEEARITAEVMGARVTTHYDVGVAGLHRLLARIESLREANVIVAVAGMEGAMVSVVGGLVAVPVIAVPTSVGYGASFGGVAALLAMLNSCASNVSVVNIDDGFSGGYVAALINRRSIAGKEAK